MKFDLKKFGVNPLGSGKMMFQGKFGGAGFGGGGVLIPGAGAREEGRISRRSRSRVGFRPILAPVLRRRNDVTSKVAKTARDGCLAPLLRDSLQPR